MELKKTISLWQGVALAVGMVVGSGLLGLPGMAIETVGADTAIVGWFLILVLLAPMIALFVKLGVAYSESAGLSKYAEVALGPWAGSSVTALLCGTFTIGIPALAMIGGAYACELIGIPQNPGMFIVAAAVLLASTVLNIAGVQMASIINTVSLYLIFILIALLVTINLDFAQAGLSSLSTELSRAPSWDIATIWTVAALLFWAFLGWENMSFGLEEFRNPKRTIPLVYWLSFALVGTIYFVLAIIATGAAKSGVDVNGIGGLEGLITEPMLRIPLLATMVFVIVANGNSWVFGASRLIYSGGTAGILPGYLGKLDRNSIPRNSLMSLCAFYMAFITIAALFDIKVADMVLLVSQNFIVLYAVSIIAFFKTVKLSVLNVLIGVVSSASCLFLLSGFTLLLLYPAALMTLGYVTWRIQNNRKSSSAVPAE